tara:strand:- start:126 stop:1673 length:1548 start_codon:yes stop_codon:yes gene_type:complete
MISYFNIFIIFILSFIYSSDLNKIEITLLGGAKQVSGSSFLIDTNLDDFLIDCGIFYPEHQHIDYDIDKYNTKDKNSKLEVNPNQISNIILTHAHLDHIGKVPFMVKKGFKGKIILTKKTAEIASVMYEKMTLKNSDFGEEKFFKSINSNKFHSHNSCKWRKKINQNNLKTIYMNRSDLDYPETMCKQCIQHELEDIESLYHIIEYRNPYNLFDEIFIEFYDAKHIPGSASILMTYDINDKKESIYFSGDVGSGIDNILEGEPENPKAVDYIFMESTYGGYSRSLSNNPFQEFYKSINQSIQNNQLIWIPSFVLDRTQKILNQIKIGYKKGYIENIPPIYILSGSAKEINKVYAKYYDFKTGFENESYNMSLRNTSYLNDKPAIIMTPSYVDDLDFFHPIIKEIIEDKDSDIYIVGYQDPRSFGGILKKIKKNEVVNLGNDTFKVNADVEYLGSAFSGHLDENGILNYINELNVKKGVYLTHGSYESMKKLKVKIDNTFDINCEIPDYEWKLKLK